MTDNHLDELLIDAQQKVVEAVEQWVRKQVIITQVYNYSTNRNCRKSFVTVSFISLLDYFEIDYIHETSKDKYGVDEYDFLNNDMSLTGKSIDVVKVDDFDFTKFSQYELQKNIEFANSVFTWIKTHEHPDENLF